MVGDPPYGLSLCPQEVRKNAKESKAPLFSSGLSECN